MLFDVHAHLMSSEFDADRLEIVLECQRKGINVIISATSPDEIAAGINLVGEHDNLHLTAGLNPSTATGDDFSKLISLLKRHKSDLAGIGEVGLDYYWIKDEAKRSAQRKMFEDFVNYSIREKLPLIVHSRDAEEDALNILEEAGCSALMHCFSGSLEQALRAVELSCLISIPTSISYSKAKQRLAAELPLEHMVLETDAPYLSPIRGERNTPLNVGKAAEVVAELKKTRISSVADITTANATRFFNLNVELF
ncbi:MAG: TatD family hydrolase [Candidatus Altiarchaeota archaeon]